MFRTLLFSLTSLIAFSGKAQTTITVNNGSMTFSTGGSHKSSAAAATTFTGSDWGVSDAFGNTNNTPDVFPYDGPATGSNNYCWGTCSWASSLNDCETAGVGGGTLTAPGSDGGTYIACKILGQSFDSEVYGIESFYQLLSSPMEAGNCHAFTIDIKDMAQCIDYYDVAGVSFEVWGGDSPTNPTELLYNSITETGTPVPSPICESGSSCATSVPCAGVWTQYNVEFTPSVNHSYIFFRGQGDNNNPGGNGAPLSACASGGSASFNGSGIIGFDNMSNITVTAGPNAGTDTTLAVCANGTPVDLFNALGGNPSTGGTWSPTLNSGTGLFDPSIDAAGVYTYELTNACGTASAVINVSINIAPNTTVNETGTTLTALQGGAMYQWLDCNNGYSPISGEANQDFTATSNGSYAVEVTLDGCVDTSSCILVESASLENLALSDAITIHPNPSSNGYFTLNIKDDASIDKILVQDAFGKTIYTNSSLKEKLIELDLSLEAKGIYFMTVYSKEANITLKLIHK